jgi:hypothetical protein
MSPTIIIQLFLTALGAASVVTGAVAQKHDRGDQSRMFFTMGTVYLTGALVIGALS